jgi:hypothetical protein
MANYISGQVSDGAVFHSKDESQPATREKIGKFFTLMEFILFRKKCAKCIAINKFMRK